MSLFGTSTEQLRSERDALEAQVSRQATALRGRMATAEETSAELRPLTTRLFRINSKILQQTSVTDLRRERAALVHALEALNGREAAPGPEDSFCRDGESATETERMQLEWKINRLDEHLLQRAPEVSWKNVLVFIGIAAALGLILELVKRAS